jgi:hypothetical protein
MAKAVSRGSAVRRTRNQRPATGRSLGARAPTSRPELGLKSGRGAAWSSFGQVAVAKHGKSRRSGDPRNRTGKAYRDSRQPRAKRFTEIAPRRSPVRVRLAPYRNSLQIRAFGYPQWAGSGGEVDDSRGSWWAIYHPGPQGARRRDHAGVRKAVASGPAAFALLLA